MNLSYIVTNPNYLTVKQILKEEFNMSDRFILRLKKYQKILLNGNNIYINHLVNINDRIDIIIDLIEDNSNIVPIKMNLDILYEDDTMLVINKGSNLPVHPSMLHYTNSLSNGIKYYFDEVGLKKKIRPVNRLDKDTSRNCYFCQKRIYSRMLSKTNAK